jgi:hypothetical protein
MPPRRIHPYRRHRWTLNKNVRIRQKFEDLGFVLGKGSA